MATAHKIIDGIQCNTADWYNFVASPNQQLSESLIAAILNHPMVDCISVPWMFSYHYQQQKKQHSSLSYARYISCKQVLDKLNRLF